MSSIYKKGRDGYFYYQTYIDNPKTGKKDKRIFHSLGTKERDEAVKKQISLDKKYYKSKNPNIQLFKKFSSKYSILITILLTSGSTLLVQDQFDKIFSYKKQKFENKRSSVKNIAAPLKNINNNRGKDFNEDISKVTEIKPTSKFKEEGVLIEKVELVLPKFTIERIERLSGAFAQGKFFLTVDESTSSSNLLKICEKVLEQYKEFSNIVICLYSDSVTGKELALGRISKVSKQESLDSWLAMYTYNSVEGAYFDDNPGGYLGAF